MPTTEAEARLTGQNSENLQRQAESRLPRRPSGGRNALRSALDTDACGGVLIGSLQRVLDQIRSAQVRKSRHEVLDPMAVGRDDLAMPERADVAGVNLPERRRLP